MGRAGTDTQRGERPRRRASEGGRDQGATSSTEAGGRKGTTTGRFDANTRGRATAACRRFRSGDGSEKFAAEAQRIARILRTQGPRIVALVPRHELGWRRSTRGSRGRAGATCDSTNKKRKRNPAP